MAKKEIDIDRYYYNPSNGDKIYSHYTDKTEVALSDVDKKKAEAAKQACIKQSQKWVESMPAAKKKPAELRGIKVKKEESKEEVKEVKQK